MDECNMNQMVVIIVDNLESEGSCIMVELPREAYTITIQIFILALQQLLWKDNGTYLSTQTRWRVLSMNLISIAE